MGDLFYPHFRKRKKILSKGQVVVCLFRVVYYINIRSSGSEQRIWASVEPGKDETAEPGVQDPWNIPDQARLSLDKFSWEEARYQ